MTESKILPVLSTNEGDFPPFVTKQLGFSPTVQYNNNIIWYGQYDNDTVNQHFWVQNLLDRTSKEYSRFLYSGPSAIDGFSHLVRAPFSDYNTIKEKHPHFLNKWKNYYEEFHHTTLIFFFYD